MVKKSSQPLPEPGDLMFAVRDNDLDEVKYLLEQGADVNEIDGAGNNVLARAASAGHLEIVKALLDKGANINGSNKNGTTVLMMAIYAHYSPAQTIIVRLLLEKGANIDAKNLKGETALDIANQTSRLTAAAMLRKEAERRQQLAAEFAKAAAAKRLEELAEKRRALNERAKKSPKPAIVPKPPQS